MPEFHTLVEIFTGVGVAVCLFLCVLATARSTPNRVIHSLQDLEARVLDAERIVESLSARWTTFREEMEQLAETVERARRRVAARESKERANGPVASGDTQLDLLRAARAQGHDV